MTTTNVRAISSGSMLGLVNNTLIDPASYLTAQLPAGAMIRNIYVRKTGTLTSGVLLKIGVAGNDDYIIPSGLSTDLLNSQGFVTYHIDGLKYPLSAAADLVVTPTLNCAGSIEVFIRYELWEDLA